MDNESFRAGYRFALSLLGATGHAFNHSAINRALDELVAGETTIRDSPADAIAELEHMQAKCNDIKIPDQLKQFVNDQLQGENRRKLENADRLFANIILTE